MLTAWSYYFTNLLYFCFHQQGAGPYTNAIKKVEEDIKDVVKKVNELTGTYCMVHFQDPWVTVSIFLE